MFPLFYQSTFTFAFYQARLGFFIRFILTLYICGFSLFTFQCFANSFTRSLADNISNEPINEGTNERTNERTNEHKWKLWKKAEHSSVSYRAVNNSDLIEIKAQLEVTSSLAGFILFIQDTPNIPLWLDNASQAKIIKSIDSTTHVFQTNFHAVWPISNRTMIIKSHYWQNNDLSLEIAIEDIGEIYQKEKEEEKIT